MNKRRNDSKTVQIGGDHTGDSIIGDGSTIHKTNVDSKGINQGLKDVSDAIYENSSQARWSYFRQQSSESESKDIRETISVAFFSGVIIGVSWNQLTPLNAVISPLIVIATTILLGTLKLTRLGLRHSLVMIGLISATFYLLLKFTIFVDTWMSINQIAGTFLLGSIGAGFGFVIGVIQMFWRPLGH